VSLDDRARDREAQSGALAAAGGIAPVERGKHLLALLRGYPVAAVRDLDFDSVRGRLRTHDDASVRGRVPDRVLDQVEQDSL
jgi:hypothetical protein